MSSESGTFTKGAIAYLKVVVPKDDPAPALEVSIDDFPILRELKNGLAVSYVVDQENEFAYVQNRHLETDRIDSTTLHSIGIANLELRSSEGIRIFPHSNIFAVVLDGNFEASLILLDSLWEESFRQFVTGLFAVAVPARDILAFCDAESSIGLFELQQVISRCKAAGADHPLSDEVFVRHGNEWHVLNASAAQ